MAGPLNAAADTGAPLPVQTGPRGTPAPPLIVSAGLAGPVAGTGRVDLAAAGAALRAALQELRVLHRARGWLGWDTWSLLRASPDGVQRAESYPDGVVPDAVWADALARIGGALDHVVLDAGTWGELDLGCPAVTVRGADVSQALAWVEVPAEGVDEAAATLLAVVRDGHGAATGFVHVDSVAEPFGAVTRDSGLAVHDFTRQVHGYTWAVRLGAGHLRVLGGRAALDGVAAAVEDLADTAVLARLTEHASQMDEPAVRRWRQTLGPVLREGYPVGAEDVGVPGTPLARPLWLFEGAPVGEYVPDVLRFGDDADVEPVPVEMSPAAADPDRPTFWLHPADGEEPSSTDTEAVRAVVGAWARTASAGRLHGLEDRRLHGCTGVSWEHDDAGRAGWLWQAELGDIDLTLALELLAAALATTGLRLALLRVS